MSAVGENSVMNTVWTLTVTILLLSDVRVSYTFECECTTCGGLKSCETSLACYVQTPSVHTREVSRGCIDKGDAVECSKHDVLCCHYDLCNGIGSRAEWQKEIDDHKISLKMIRDASTPSSSNHNFRTITIITAALSFVTISVFLSSIIISLAYCYCCRKRSSEEHSEQDLEDGHSPTLEEFGSGNMCEAFIPQGESIESLMEQATSHNSQCSSPSQLIQRAVVRCTKLIKNVEKGSFYDVHIGEWRTEPVHVKVYLERHKKFWFAESQIYQVPCMRHENILGFIAADIQQRRGVQLHFLINNYHEQGTLQAFLKRNVIDVNGLIGLALSLANGLSHLHMEYIVSGTAVRPAIAHRNITSSSVYVKSDRSCCIGDLCYAVQNDSTLETEVQNRPVQCYRYLAPEYLSSSTPQATFDNLRRADMYSFGLVLWEISRRCAIQGMVEDAMLPYSKHVSSDTPSMEEMREVTHVRELRPSVCDQWNRDESMRLILRTMTECWHQNCAVRLTALRVRKTLEKLAASVRAYYDKNGKVILTEIDRTQYHS